MLFCTLARKEQMANAIIWAETIRYYHPDSFLVLGMLEHTIRPEHLAYFNEAIYVSNHGVPPVTAESGCAAKAEFIRNTLHRTDRGMLIYMDPETRLYTPVEELHQLLQNHSIVAVPYYLEPCADPAKEAERVQKGMFDTALIGLRNSPEAKSFADWWAHVVHASFYGPDQDPYADSRWLDVTTDIHGIHILKDPAYGLSAYNMTEPSRAVHTDHEGVKLGDGRWLRCMNFSNPGGLLDRELLKLPRGDRRSAMEAMINGYRQQIGIMLPNPARSRKKKLKKKPFAKRRIARRRIPVRNRSVRKLAAARSLH